MDINAHMFPGTDGRSAIITSLATRRAAAQMDAAESSAPDSDARMWLAGFDSAAGEIARLLDSLAWRHVLQVFGVDEPATGDPWIDGRFAAYRTAGSLL